VELAARGEGAIRPAVSRRVAGSAGQRSAPGTASRLLAAGRLPSAPHEPAEALDVPLSPREVERRALVEEARCEVEKLHGSSPSQG
jgi:hypothetical protein